MDKNFIAVNWWEPEVINIKHAKKLPLNAIHICGVSWGWGPGNARFSNYYISSNSSRSHWILWHRYPDLGDEGPWISAIAAYCKKSSDLSIKTAAFNLLLASWKWECEFNSSFDKNFESEPGLLSIDELESLIKLF